MSRRLLSCLASRQRPVAGSSPALGGLLVFTAGAKAGVGKIDWSPGAWRRLGRGAGATAGLHVGGEQRLAMSRALPCVRLGGALRGRRSGPGSRSSRGRRGRTSSLHGGTARGAGKRWSRGHGPVLAQGPPGGGCLGSSTSGWHPGSLRPGDSERPFQHPLTRVLGSGAWQLCGS